MTAESFPQTKRFPRHDQTFPSPHQPILPKPRNRWKSSKATPSLTSLQTLIQCVVTHSIPPPSLLLGPLVIAGGPAEASVRERYHTGQGSVGMWTYLRRMTWFLYKQERLSHEFCKGREGTRRRDGTGVADPIGSSTSLGHARPAFSNERGPFPAQGGGSLLMRLEEWMAIPKTNSRARTHPLATTSTATTYHGDIRVAITTHPFICHPSPPHRTQAYSAILMRDG
jgi:hypothetical protein